MKSNPAVNETAVAGASCTGSRASAGFEKMGIGHMELRIADLAQQLGLPTETLDRWIRQGRIPVHRDGDHCVFRKAVLARWAAAHDLRFSTRRSTSPPTPEERTAPENLKRVMERGGIVYDLAAADADSALKGAVAGISDLPPAGQEALLAGLREREAMASTGIGNGVAIPHPRTPLEGMIDPARIITFFLREPVDFSAVDDRPVFVLFLMLSPSIKIHLHLLSRLSFCVRDDRFVGFLRSRPEPAALLSRIAEFEQTLDAAGT